MTHTKKTNINKAIYQNLRKKDNYKSDMENINNLTIGQTNEQPQNKMASDATFQVVKTDKYSIGYLMILKRL